MTAPAAMPAAGALAAAGIVTAAPSAPGLVLPAARLVLAADRGRLTPAGLALIESHRVAQVAVQAAALRELTPLWAVLDPQRLDATTDGWLRLVRDVVVRHRAESSRLAGQFYGAFRALQTGVLANPWTAVAATAGIAALSSAMVLTGPVGIKSRVGRGVPLEAAVRKAFVESCGAATRAVLDAGRSSLIDTVERDSEAVGWARVTDRDPCAWCAMLAGRGYVYKSSDTATFTAGGHGRFHGGCACVAVAAFSREQPLHPRSEHFDALYAEVTGDHHGQDKVRAFRRAYEDMQRRSA